MLQLGQFVTLSFGEFFFFLLLALSQFTFEFGFFGFLFGDFLLFLL